MSKHKSFRQWFPLKVIDKLRKLDKWRPLSWHLPTRIDQEINRSFVSWRTQRAEENDRASGSNISEDTTLEKVAA